MHRQQHQESLLACLLFVLFLGTRGQLLGSRALRGPSSNLLGRFSVPSFFHHHQSFWAACAVYVCPLEQKKGVTNEPATSEWPLQLRQFRGWFTFFGGENTSKLGTLKCIEIEAAYWHLNRPKVCIWEKYSASLTGGLIRDFFFPTDFVWGFHAVYLHSKPQEELDWEKERVTMPRGPDGCWPAAREKVNDLHCMWQPASTRSRREISLNAQKRGQNVNKNDSQGASSKPTMMTTTCGPQFPPRLPGSRSGTLGSPFYTSLVVAGAFTSSSFDPITALRVSVCVCQCHSFLL